MSTKKYFWNWTSNEFMDEDIEDFIEVSKKQKNKWWNNLNFFILYKSHKDYFKTLASSYFRGIQHNETSDLPITAKTCPAIGNGLLDKCILIKLPCDISISISEDGSLFYFIKDTARIDIQNHPTSQFYTEKNNPFKNKINLKFVLPITLDLKGDTYMFLQPQFHQQNYPFEVVNGSINKRRASPNINVLIDIPKEQTEYTIKKGTILAYLWLDNKNIILEKNEKLKNMRNSKFFGNN